MLQLQTKNIEICRISKLLVKFNVKVRITDSVITLDGDVSDELLTQLCGKIDITNVKNFISLEPLYASQETESPNVEQSIPCKNLVESENAETLQSHSTLSHHLSEYELIYSEIKRGEAYWCDFGDAYGCEQGGYRPAIVIQNDYGNLHSSTTIVIPCTTENKKSLPVHHSFTFSSENILDYDSTRIGSKENIALLEQIRTIDKTRLRKYIGTLTP